MSDLPYHLEKFAKSQEQRKILYVAWIQGFITRPQLKKVYTSESAIKSNMERFVKMGVFRPEYGKFVLLLKDGKK